MHSTKLKEGDERVSQLPPRHRAAYLESLIRLVGGDGAE